MAAAALELWQQLIAQDNTDTDLSDVEVMEKKSGPKSQGPTTKLSPKAVQPEDEAQAITLLLEHSLESILHDILLDVHREQKQSRIQSALIELDQKVESEQNQTSPEDSKPYEQLDIEIESAHLREGAVHLKGNPFETVKKILCPNCHLPRLLYPRVGFGSRPPPDPNQQYCKNEPPIIIDKHDVHGQRKKGVKLKGQVKSKSKKKTDAASPAPSENSDPLTPSTNSFGVDSFEFKEIEVPAAKCPHRDPQATDHWKPVTQFATHLTGSCWLKRDRAAGREANAKISATPRDSRANSPKVPNGNKRGRPADDNDEKASKKQKLDTPKRGKNAGSGNRSQDSPSRKNEEVQAVNENESEKQDVVKVKLKKPRPAESDSIKPEVNGLATGEKSGKLTKKASGNK